jgi:stage V sporulation protein B
MKYNTRVVKGVRLVFLVGLGASVLAYLLKVALARSLSLEDFGLFFAVFTLITFTNIFTDLGLRNASVKYVSEYVATKKHGQVTSTIVSSLTIQLILAVIIYAGFYLLAPWLAATYIRSTAATELIRVLALFVFTSLLFMNARSLLKGFQDVKWFVWADIIRLSTVLMFFVGMYSSLGIFAAVYGYLLGDLIGFTILCYPLSKYLSLLKKSSEIFISSTKRMLSFGIPVIFTGIGEKVLGYFDVLILTYLVSLEQVGIYNVVLPSAVVLLALASASTTILFPMASELWAKKKYDELTAVISVVKKYLFILSLPVIAYVFFVAGPILELFFGPEFASGTIALQILLPGVLAYMFAKLNFAVISAQGHPKQVTKVMLVAAMINVVMNLGLIPSLGIIGAAIATSASYIFAWVCSPGTGGISRKSYLAIILAGVLAYGVAWVLPLNSISSILMGAMITGAAYILAVYVFKIIDLKEIGTLVSGAVLK